MKEIVKLLKHTPVFSEFDDWTLQYIAGVAKRKRYKPKEWLFHQSEPRGWFGIVERGEVGIVRSPERPMTCAAILGRGGILSGRLLLEDLPHTVGCFTQEGAVVVRFSREALERIRKDRPDLHYRIVARVNEIMSDRIRYAAGRPTIEYVSHLERNPETEETKSSWNILGKN